MQPLFTVTLLFYSTSPAFAINKKAGLLFWGYLHSTCAKMSDFKPVLVYTRMSIYTLLSELSRLGLNFDPAIKCHLGVSQAGRDNNMYARPNDGC